jgi:uncharacterized protein
MAKKTKKSTPKPRAPKLVKRNVVKRKILPLKTCKETPYPLMNKDGNLLAGVLHEPPKKSDILVIIIPGFTGSKNDIQRKQLAIELSRVGYAAYRVDLSGHGDSEGRFEDSTPLKKLKDILAITEHFRKAYKKIILAGFSLGGTFSIMAASKVKIDGLVLVATPVNMDALVPRLFNDRQREQLRSVGFTIVMRKSSVGELPYTFTQQYIDELLALQPLAMMRDVHCPVFVIHGSADTTVPASDGGDIAQQINGADILLIGGAEHSFTNPAHLDALIAGVIEWLRKL